MDGALRLSDVLARRGHLAPAEVVTLVAGLALDLAALHAAGGCHGAVCADAVGFDQDGRPRLRGAGAAAAPGGPAGDVYGVAALGYLALGDLALGGRPAPRLVEALAAALADDPEARCDAGELAERVLASGPAAPMRLPYRLHDHREIPSNEAGFPASPAVRRRVFGVAAAAVVVSAAVMFVPWPSTGGRAQWDDVLAGLDRARLRAVADRAAGELAAVYDPASVQLSRDTALVRELARRGLSIRGRLAELASPRLLARDARTATLAAVERPAAYVLVAVDGHVALRVRGDDARNVVVHLRRTANGWRISGVDERGASR